MEKPVARTTDMTSYNDDRLIEIFGDAATTVRVSRGRRVGFGRDAYSEMLSRQAGERREYRYAPGDMATVVEYVNAHGGGAMPIATEEVKRFPLLEAGPNDLAGALDLPEFVSKPALTASDRPSVGLLAVRKGRVVFRGNHYAILRHGKLTDPRSLFIPTYREVEKTEFVRFRRCLFAGTLRSSDNISHFTFDTLPRIQLALRKFKFDAVVLSPPFANRGYQQFLIDLLGIPVVTLPPGGGVAANQLCFFDNVGLALSHPANYCHSSMLDAIAIEPLTPPVADKVYISRLDAPDRRPMVNERKLADILEKRGFKIVLPTDHHPREQIGWFQNADVIVGPHGAGLTGVFAARPGAIFVELFSPKATAAYASVAAARGLDYRYVAGTAVPGRPYAFEIDIDAVLAALPPETSAL